MNLPTSADYLIFSDCHGCFHTLTRLLNVAPKGVQLICLGDNIDRGPSSRAVVKMMMEKQVPTCAGNHEDLAIAFYRPQSHASFAYEKGIWLENGGRETLRNWPCIDHRCSTPAEQTRVNRDRYLGGRVPDTVLDWMEQLPAYLYPSTQLDANGRRLLASHTGFGLAADKGDWFTALWCRQPHGEGKFPDDGNFRAFGHSPCKSVEVTEKWCNIDTGAAYGKRGYGTLSAMLWPSKLILTQPYDETPVKANFTVELGGLIT